MKTTKVWGVFFFCLFLGHWAFLFSFFSLYRNAKCAFIVLLVQMISTVSVKQLSCITLALLYVSKSFHGVCFMRALMRVNKSEAR